MNENEPPSPYVLPEHVLLQEVLAQAIRDLSSDNMGIRREARLYLSSKSKAPFTSRWICEKLGLHPIALIQALRRYDEIELAVALRCTRIEDNQGYNWRTKKYQRIKRRRVG